MVRAPIFLLVWSNIFQCTGLSGIYLVLFTATTYVLLWGSKARKSIRSNMLVVSFAIFVIATMVRSGFFFPSMRLSLSVARQKRLTRSIWRRISLALSLPSSSTLDAPGGPASFFNELSNFTQMFGSTLYVMQTLLGDALVVCSLFSLCACASEGPFPRAVSLLPRLGAEALDHRFSVDTFVREYRCVPSCLLSILLFPC